MPGEMMELFDPVALAVVLAGTALATLARSGLGHAGLAFGALIRLQRGGFDADANRAAIARIVPDIRRHGPLCSDGPLPPDPVFARLVDRYLAKGQIGPPLAEARAQRLLRERRAQQAASVFEQAGEIAPVFGLVGTLLSITQLMPVEGAGAAEATMTAVAGAVLSTLYGVLAAHLLCVPLARAIERSSADEEFARSQLLDWFEAELERAHGDMARRASATLRGVA